MRQKHPALIVLKGLLDGHPVFRDGEEWRYHDGTLGVVRNRLNTKTGESEQVVLRVEWPFDHFVQWCERFTEQELAQVVFSTVIAEGRKGTRQ